jgi:3-phenylpropionate/trans-cinnamate dioxygenase ferredoxin reductase subunit
MSMKDHLVIIGASHTAAQLIVSARQNGWAGDITLIGDEAHLPYHRPPLSKDFLSGKKAIDDILIRPADSYAAAEVTLRLGVRADAIDRATKTISLSDGSQISYSKLVLATGARVRKLPVPGADLEQVYYLRDSGDVDDLRRRSQSSKRAVIIGGGYIGLETAASLRKLGLAVTVIEAMPRILQRVTTPIMSDFFRRLHREEGVDLVEGEMVNAISAVEDGVRVLTKSGLKFSADFVVIGIGVIPNVELAEDAALKVENGIVVDSHCLTNDPDIYAAGDVAARHHELYDQPMRIESVPNTTEQAKMVAAHLTGRAAIVSTVPWFWSDQYDVKLQIAGLSTDIDDQVTRGDINSRAFAVFSFKDNKLVCVDAVNDPRSFMFGKLAMTKNRVLDHNILADPASPHKSAFL